MFAACAAAPPPPAPFDPATAQSVRPGINADFTNPRLDIDAMAERIEGTSRQWIVDHVRYGRETAIQEVTAADFALVVVVPVGWTENYFLRFKERG